MARKVRLDSPPQKIENNDNSWKGFLGLISFSTILPLNIHTSIQEMARFTWTWPFIGGFIGILVGLVAFLVVSLLHLPLLLSAALIYSFTITITGLHHLDGLIDFADGLMVHGDHQKRIEVMRDERIGTGGLSSLLMVSLITIASLAALPVTIIPIIIIISEIAAKLGLITCATLSRPSGDGTGTYFIESMTPTLLAISLIVSIIIGYFAVEYIGLGGIVGGFVMGVIMALLARYKFKYTTGDVLGATNELSRMLALFLMVVVFTIR